MHKVTTAWLQSIEAIKDVPEDQLQWMIDNSEHYIIPAGEFLFKPGNPIRGTHIIISGKIRAFQLQNREARELAVFETKSISGYLPFSRGKNAIAAGFI